MLVPVTSLLLLASLITDVPGYRNNNFHAHKQCQARMPISCRDDSATEACSGGEEKENSGRGLAHESAFFPKTFPHFHVIKEGERR